MNGRSSVLILSPWIRKAKTLISDGGDATFICAAAFRPTNARTTLRGNEFEVVCMGDFDAAALGEIMARIHAVEPAFGSEVIMSGSDL